MATPIAELFVSVGADVSEALLGLNALAGALDSTKSGFEGATPAAEALVGLGAGIAAGLGAATVAAADFNNMLAQTQNNTTLTDQDMQSINETILRLGQEAPVSFDNLAEGLRHIINFGFSAADATGILDVAMKSATSTGGNTAQTAEVLSAILHEFGLNASDAARTMDQLHLAAAEGNLTLEQFSSSFGQVAAFAAAVGVPLDQAAAAMSAMTRHGFDAATAATQVKDAIVHLINPSQEAQKAIADLSSRSGIDLKNALTSTGLHANGLTGTLDLVTSAMNKVGLTQDQQTALWLKLVPNIRGGAAAFVLAGRGAEDYAQILKDLDGNINVTDEAFTRIQQQASFQWGTLGNQFKALGIEIGQFLLPALTPIIARLSDMIKQFENLPDSVKQGLVNITAFGAGLALLVGGFILLAPFLAALPAAFAVISAAIGSVAPFIAIAVGAFALMRAAWENDFAGIQEIASNFSNIGDIVEAALSGQVGPAFEGLVQDFARISPQFREFIDTIQQGIIPAAEAMATVIVNDLGPSFNTLSTTAIPNLIQAGLDLVNLYLTPAKLAFEAVTSGPAIAFFGALANAISAVLSIGLDLVSLYLTPVQLAFEALSQTPIVGFFQSVADSIGPLATDVATLASNMQGIGDFFNSAALGLNSFADSVRNFPLPDVLKQSLGAQAQTAVGNAVNGPGGVPGAALNANGGNGPLLQIGSIAIGSEVDAKKFLSDMAAVISQSARRVSPPTDNTAFPALSPGGGPF